MSVASDKRIKAEADAARELLAQQMSEASGRIFQPHEVLPPEPVVPVGSPKEEKKIEEPINDKASEPVVPEDNKTEESTKNKKYVRDDNDPNSETYKSKYLSLQGIYRNVKGELDEAKSTIDFLSNRVEALEKAKPPEDTPAYTKAELQHMDDDELIELFGENTLNKLYSNIDKRIEDRVDSKVKAKLSEEMEPVKKTMAQSRQDRFWSDIANAGIDWLALEGDGVEGSPFPVDPEWAAFVSLPTNRIVGEAALSNLDSQALITLIRKFEQEVGAYRSSFIPSNEPTKTPKQPKPIAPPAGRSAVPPIFDEKRIYTRADAAQFLKDVEKGVYVNKPEERQKIMSAMIEQKLISF